MVSRSPERNTFQRDAYIKERAKEGKTPENDESVKAMVAYYDSWNAEAEKRAEDPEWQKDNMEYDLRSTGWILEKARASDGYAQNLYAAMCNNEFIKNDVWPLLQEKTWSASWRYAGGIIADMLGKGDYIDWYCSGMGSGLGNGDEKGTKGYVPESHVTDEIREDLLKLGWIVKEDDESK